MSHEMALQSWATLACLGVALALAFVVPGYNMFALLPLLLLRTFAKAWSRLRSTNAA